MPNLFTVEIDDNSLLEFGRKFRRGKQNAVAKALDEIRRDWQQEFVTQQRNFHRSKRWPDLNPDYLDRKRYEYSNRSRYPEVRYVTTLKRSGRMLARYISGIQVDTSNYSVSIPFPIDPFGRDKQGIRALVHQGVVGQPKGVPVRPWDVNRFGSIADRIIRNALTRDNG